MYFKHKVSIYLRFCIKVQNGNGNAKLYISEVVFWCLLEGGESTNEEASWTAHPGVHIFQNGKTIGVTPGALSTLSYPPLSSGTQHPHTSQVCGQHSTDTQLKTTVCCHKKEQNGKEKHSHTWGSSPKADSKYRNIFYPIC